MLMAECVGRTTTSAQRPMHSTARHATTSTRNDRERPKRIAFRRLATRVDRQRQRVSSQARGAASNNVGLKFKATRAQVQHGTRLDPRSKTSEQMLEQSAHAATCASGSTQAPLQASATRAITRCLSNVETPTRPTMACVNRNSARHDVLLACLSRTRRLDDDDINDEVRFCMLA